MTEQPGKATRDEMRRSRRGGQEWLTARAGRRWRGEELAAVAGHPFEVDAARLLPRVRKGDVVRWRVDGETQEGPAFRWTPPSPGFFRLTASAGSRSAYRRVTVGLCPSDLVDRREQLEYFFSLVVRSGNKVHFVPLIEDKLGTPDTALLEREVRQHHGAFARFTDAHTGIYRDQVLPHPYLETDAIPTGLYAVFSADLIYLGETKETRAAADGILSALARIATEPIGGGAFVRDLSGKRGRLGLPGSGLGRSTEPLAVGAAVPRRRRPKAT
jgi:hypothetical protein